MLLFLTDLGALPAAERQQEAAEGPYLSFSVHRVSSFAIDTTSPTLSPSRIETRPGHQIGAGLGYRRHDTRIEGNLVSGRFEADSIRFGEGGGSLSGYFDLRGVTLELTREFTAGGPLQPYLGAGLGVIRFRANDVTLGDFPPTEGASTLLSYQFTAGVAYAAGPWRFSLGYRYMGLGEQGFETGPDSLRADPLRIDGIQAGLELAF